MTTSSYIFSGCSSDLIILSGVPSGVASCFGYVLCYGGCVHLAARAVYSGVFSRGGLPFLSYSAPFIVESVRGFTAMGRIFVVWSVLCGLFLLCCLCGSSADFFLLALRLALLFVSLGACAISSSRYPFFCTVLRELYFVIIAGREVGLSGRFVRTSIACVVGRLRSFSIRREHGYQGRYDSCHVTTIGHANAYV